MSNVCRIHNQPILPSYQTDGNTIGCSVCRKEWRKTYLDKLKSIPVPPPSERPCSKHNKPITRANWRHGYRKTGCRACSPPSKNNTHKERNKKRKRKEMLVAYKGGRCLDCGVSYPACCFDFDHRDPNDKTFSVTRQILMTWERMVIELDKCDLVCANCHRIRTFGDTRIREKLVAAKKRWAASRLVSI